MLYWWGRGEQLNLIRLYSLFGGVFVLFIAVNSLTYLGTVSLQTFVAILQRYSDVIALPEK